VRWVARGVELPSGDEGEWFAGEATPNAEPQELPGRFVLRGLVDAHAHPAVALGDAGPVALNARQAKANLVAWGHSGVVLARDTGSPGGLTLSLTLDAGSPRVIAAGRFLAPKDRYFPALLVEPVADEELVDAALAEIERGAHWVKVIADFPDIEAGTPPERTYPIELLSRLSDAVHTAGARVAAHATLDDVTALVRAGVDSIEHGSGLDADSLALMADRGVAWTPTLCALQSLLDDEQRPAEVRQRMHETAERVTALLPMAARLGVPVLAGTDVSGSLAQEVALLARYGLEPSQALAAATTWARQFLHATDDAGNDIVTYAHDPREDLLELAQPLAVVIGGVRVR
jgi:imidazolonepropionase-like amidohydrolase